MNPCLLACPLCSLLCAQNALEELMCPHGVAAVLPTLFEAMLAQKWQTNEGACKTLQVRLLQHFRLASFPLASACWCKQLFLCGGQSLPLAQWVVCQLPGLQSKLHLHQHGTW